MRKKLKFKNEFPEWTEVRKQLMTKEENEILYHRIRVATPIHNGKVERQHRLDEKRFYSKMRMYNLEDGRKQLAKYNKLSNSISKCCLNYQSPNTVLEKYLGVM